MKSTNHCYCALTTRQHMHLPAWYEYMQKRQYIPKKEKEMLTKGIIEKKNQGHHRKNWKNNSPPCVIPKWQEWQIPLFNFLVHDTYPQLCMNPNTFQEEIWNWLFANRNLYIQFPFHRVPIPYTIPKNSQVQLSRSVHNRQVSLSKTDI